MTPAVFASATSGLWRWWERRAARADLHALDDHMLRDLGIRRSEIGAAVRGEFYRLPR